MANWNTLKTAVADIINTNGNQAITGQLLQNVLNNIITNVGENATFAGIATLDTNPGAPDGPVFYLATTAGVYPNFNGLEVLDGEAIIFLWNNSAWTKKVTGFATQEKLQELEENTNEKLSQLGLKTIIDGYYVNYQNGGILPLSWLKYIEMRVSYGMKIKYDYINSVLDARGLAFYDLDGNFISGFQALETSQTIEVPEGAVLCKATVSNENEVFLYGYNNALFLLEKKQKESIVKDSAIIDGYYVNYQNGGILPLSWLKYIEMRVSYGMKIKYDYINSVLDARGLAFYDLDGNFISGFQALETSQTIEVPEGAVLCKATVSNENEVHLYGYNNAISIISEVSNQVNLLGSFDEILCIGDSLTWSQVYLSTTNQRQAYQTYPKIIQKLTGTPTVSYARAGASAESCYNEFENQINKQVVNGLAIIYLGTNLGLTNSVDKDIIGDNTESWPLNQLGYYCRFVEKLKKLGYKILLLKVWACSGTGESDLTNTRLAIESVAEKFNVAVIDVPVNHDDKFHYYPDKTGKNGVHYNDLGYAWFANALIHDIGKLNGTMLSRLLVE